MAKVPTVKRVEPSRKTVSEDVKIGTLVEKRDHPWVTTTQARRIAKDELRKNPNAYKMDAAGTSDVNVTLAQNVKAIAPRKKKKVAPQPIDNGPGWIPRNLRFYG